MNDIHPIKDTLTIFPTFGIISATVCLLVALLLAAYLVRWWRSRRPQAPLPEPRRDPSDIRREYLARLSALQTLDGAAFARELSLTLREYMEDMHLLARATASTVEEIRGRDTHPSTVALLARCEEIAFGRAGGDISVSERGKLLREAQECVRMR